MPLFETSHGIASTKGLEFSIIAYHGLVSNKGMELNNTMICDIREIHALV
jgi:hypothetical protein